MDKRMQQPMYNIRAVQCQSPNYVLRTACCICAIPLAAEIIKR